MAFTLVEFTQFNWGAGSDLYVDPASVKALSTVTYQVAPDQPPTTCVRLHCAIDGSMITFDVTQTMHQVVQILSGV